MDSNLNNNKKKPDEYDIAVNIAWKEFESRHSSLPEWLNKCIRISGSKNSKNKWLIKLSVLPKIKLQPNQHVEEINGNSVLVNTNPLTGEERIVICGGPSVDIEILFQIEVDIFNNSTAIITDTELGLLDGTKYEFNNC